MPLFKYLDAQRIIAALEGISVSLRTLNQRSQQTMSQISDFATTIKAKLDAEQAKISSLSDRINAVISNSTTLSDSDKASLQAISDEIDAHGTELDNLASNTVAPVAAQTTPNTGAPTPPAS